MDPGWAVGVVLAVLSPLLGCDGRQKPGSQTPAASASTPPSAPTPTIHPERSVDLDEGPDTAPPSGGSWATCYEGFRTSGQPLRDVTRLGFLCGPMTGMRAARPPFERAVAAGESVAFDVPVGKGECFRVFATADGGAILTMSTSARPGGAAVRSRHGQGWVVLRPGAPICSKDPDTVSVVLQADRACAVAVAPWILPL